MSQKKVVLSDNALQVAQARYFNNGEDWETCTYRVGKAVSEVEKEKGDYANKFHEMIYNMDFIPGGRILRNAGRPKGSMLNCYVCPIQDSIEDIGQFIKDSLTLWSEGGGVGCNFSPLRPAGTPILGKGGVSSGLVSFIEAADAVSKTIESGGQRRAAALACVDVSHPEVMDFINAKLKDGRLSHFNISVVINEDFLKAVEADAPWTFKFNQIEYKTVKAREIWDLVVNNMVHMAEPGLLNGSNLYKNNSYYFDPVVSTNPCVTGETLIAVADGREHVSIKQLSEEGNDIPVYSFNRKNGKVEIKMMRNPRITGYDQKILKVGLDDGSFVRCTENHKFIMKDGSEKEAKNLKVGDRLHHIKKTNKGMLYPYFTCNRGYNGNDESFEHRIVSRYFHASDFGTCVKPVVHHIDYDKNNNSPNNLKVMSENDHNKLHSIDKMGDLNPMNRFPEKNWLTKQDWSGDKNGRFKGYSPEEMFIIAINESKKINRRLTSKEWEDICRENDYPLSKYSVGNFDSFNGMLKEAAKQAGVYIYENSVEIREYKKYQELLGNTDLNIFWNNGIFVLKKCEHCGNDFVTSWTLRERCFCSVECSNKNRQENHSYKQNKKASIDERQYEIRKNQINIFNELKYRLGRDPFVKEWDSECKEKGVPARIRTPHEKNVNEYCFKSYQEVKDAASFNYRVVSIEEDGYENVYNGTVDENHNYMIMCGNSSNKEFIEYNYIVTKNCGEAVLENYGSCCLGSLVLPNFITGTTNTNWQKLEKTIKLAVRFLDNVIDINKYTLKEIDQKAHNSRRIGLGIMGLADYLFAKELRYGSKEALVEIERLMRNIRDIAYQTSVEIAMEKGSFPKFDPVYYGNASFIRKLPASLRMDIKSKGIRNVTLLSIAPTGTISLLRECSGGIEPVMFKSFKRKDRVGERTYVHPKYKQLLLTGNKVPEWFVDMTDLTPKDHFETQAVIQRYVDGAVSKTINMPAGTTEADLSALLLEYVHELKGCTIYVDGSRYGQVYNNITEEEALEYLLNESVSNELSVDDVECNCQKAKDDNGEEVDGCIIPSTE